MNQFDRLSLELKWTLLYFGTPSKNWFHKIRNTLWPRGRLLWKRLFHRNCKSSQI